MKKLILLIVAAIAAASYLVYAYMNGDPMFGTLAKTMDDLPRNERLGSKRNIVVLGVDGREKDDDPGRSDTLFVVMFDPKSKNVSLLSIPRDTRVRIPGHGWDKINHAYAFGGHKLTQQTTEELLGIQVNNYVMVDFSGFESLVDAIGGIDIDVEKDMYYYDDWDDFLIDLPAGQQHLDGKKAIQYVRYRDEEGDIGRIKRQQKFMMAVYEKIASAQILTKMPGLVSEIMKMVKTDLPVSDMLAMGGALHGMMKEQGGLQMATVPGTPEYIDEISYWIPDITDLREQMVDMQGAQMTERYRQGAEKMEAEYKRNLITAQEKEKQKAAEEKIKDRSWSWYHCRSGTGCGRCRFRQNMDRTFWYYLYEYDQNDHRSFGFLVSRHWCLQFGGYQKDRPYRRQNYGLLFGNYGICDCTWYIFRYGFRTGRRREYAW